MSSRLLVETAAPSATRHALSPADVETRMRGMAPDRITMASVGPLVVVFWVNRVRQRINVLDVSWPG